MKDIVRSCDDEVVRIIDMADGGLPTLLIKGKINRSAWGLAVITPSIATITISALQEYLASQPGMQKPYIEYKFDWEIDTGVLSEDHVEVYYTKASGEIELTKIICDGVDISKLVTSNTEQEMLTAASVFEEDKRLGL